MVIINKPRGKKKESEKKGVATRKKKAVRKKVIRRKRLTNVPKKVTRKVVKKVSIDEDRIPDDIYELKGVDTIIKDVINEEIEFEYE
jgi:transposase